MKQIIITTFILLLLSSFLFSQEISQMHVIGNGKLLKSELIDKNITDANGDVCAAIMVQTDLTGLSYDSNNGIVKVTQNKGEDIVFLSPNERVLKVLKSGYKPIQIILSDVEIILKSGQIWKLELTGDKIGNLIPITLLTKPSGATVFIDGVDKGIGTTFQVSEGEHTVKFEMKGSNTLTDIINVTPDNIIFSYQLDITQLQVVTISSVPNGANVSIAGEVIGTTDMQKFLAPGKYSLGFRKVGFLPQDLEVNVEPNTQNTFEIILKEQQKIVGDLQFSIKPFKADVKLFRDNKIVDFWSGLKIINNLLVGEYRIEASLFGHRSISKDIVIKDGEITLIELLLEITGNDMILVEGGNFQFGSNNGRTEVPYSHSVDVSSFLISKYEVTNGDYNVFCLSTGRKQLDVKEPELEHPVTSIDWFEASAYCKWAGGRLLTEAEWEYAAKGGQLSKRYKYCGSDNVDEVAWYNVNSGKITHEVGTKMPNELGIYDMSGNVWEWCNDWYYENYSAYSQRNNTNPNEQQSEEKVIRGGSWFYDYNFCLITSRQHSNPNKSFNNGGFRLVKDIESGVNK